MVEHFSSKCEALGFIPSATETIKPEKKPGNIVNQFEII
jgi:hypothetical protein